LFSRGTNSASIHSGNKYFQFDKLTIFYLLFIYTKKYALFYSLGRK
jgi:hypothetical protein